MKRHVSGVFGLLAWCMFGLAVAGESQSYNPQTIYEVMGKSPILAPTASPEEVLAASREINAWQPALWQRRWQDAQKKIGEDTSALANLLRAELGSKNVGVETTPYANEEAAYERGSVVAYYHLLRRERIITLYLSYTHGHAMLGWAGCMVPVKNAAEAEAISQATKVCFFECNRGIQQWLERYSLSRGVISQANLPTSAQIKDFVRDLDSRISAWEAANTR